MAAKIVLGLQRVQKQKQKTTLSLARPSVRPSIIEPIFGIDLIDQEYGEELNTGDEEGKQVVRDRKSSIVQLTPKSRSNLSRLFSRENSHGSDPGTPKSASSHSLAPEPDADRRQPSTQSKLKQVTIEFQARPWYVIDPHNVYKVRWDVFIALIIIYSVLVIPWRIGFSQEATGSAFLVEVIIDCCFVIDIILTFLTGFYDDREICITAPRAIAWRYLTKFLVIDVVSVLPIDLIVDATSAGSNNSSAKVTKLLRMVRLLKLGRLFRLKRLTQLLEDKASINMQMMNMVKVIGQVVFLIHMLACACYWVTSPACPGNRPEEPCDDLAPEDRSWGSTWVRMFHVDRLNVMSRYITSFHLVTATVMAVGYGDVYPSNNQERIFSICTQLIGAIVFGFILSAVTTLIETASPRDIESKARMNQLKVWLVGRDLPVSLRHKIWNHFTYLTSQRSIFKDETDILGNLPTGLRIKLVEQLRQEYIQRAFKIFPNEEICLVIEVALLLRPSQCSCNEVIIEAGEPPLDIFLIKTGRIEAVLDDVDLPARMQDVEFIMAENMQAPGSSAHSAWASQEEMRSGVRSTDEGQAGSERQDSEAAEAPAAPGAIGQPAPPNARPHKLAQRGVEKQDPATVGSSGCEVRTLRAPSPPAPLHLPFPDGKGESSMSTASGGGAAAATSCAVGSSSSRRHAAEVSLRLSPPRYKVDPSLWPDTVLCAMYSEGEAFGEISVSPIRFQGGEVRSEILALCKDELSGILSQFTGAELRYAEYQRQAMRALWEAVMSEEWTSSVPWSGRSRRKIKSRLLYQGRATPVNEIPSEAFQDPSEQEPTPEVLIFATRRLDPKTGSSETRNETMKELLDRWIIPPNYRYKIRWDFFVGALILYSVLIIPFQFGFDITPDSWNVAVDIIVDVFFISDMAVSFRCAYIDSEGCLNTIPVDIRRHYLQGYFISDFLSSVPIDWLLQAVIPGGMASRAGLRQSRMLRFARLFRLLKLVRVFKLARLLRLANTFVEIPPLFIRMISLFLKICFMAHLVGCFWFYVSTVKISDYECASGKLNCEYDQPSTNWYAELGPGSDADTYLKKYLITVYWVFTTMTTVGYGDITPTNDLERIYCVVVMIFGATVFGYIIGSIAEISSSREDAFSMKLCVMRDFCEERGLNQRTQSYVQRHYQFWYQEMTPLHDEPTLLHQLPPSLKTEVLLYIHRNCIRTVALFRRPLPDWFVATTVRLLEPQAFSPGSDIVGPDEAGMHQDFIFVQEGLCEAYRPVAATGPAHRQSIRNHVLTTTQLDRRKKRIMMHAEAGDVADEDNPELDIGQEGFDEDEIVEVLRAGAVWGFDPMLVRVVEGKAPSHLVCLRCGSEDPCFVYALRQGVLSEINDMQMDYASMVQEVLSATILRQAVRQGRHRPSVLKATGGSRSSSKSSKGSRNSRISQQQRAPPTIGLCPPRSPRSASMSPRSEDPIAGGKRPSVSSGRSSDDAESQPVGNSGEGRSSTGSFAEKSGLREAATACYEDSSKMRSPSPDSGDPDISRMVSSAQSASSEVVGHDVASSDAFVEPQYSSLGVPEDQVSSSTSPINMVAGGCDGCTGATWTPQSKPHVSADESKDVSLQSEQAEPASSETQGRNASRSTLQ
jgi:hypothetical protein